jgi:hypothetical protein
VKRRLFKLVVFLLLGVIVNVAVAWGFALWGSYRFGSSSQYHSHATQPRWLISVHTGVGVTRVSLIPNNDIWGEQSPTYRPKMIPNWSAALRRPSAEVFEDQLGPWTLEYAYGWPFRSGRAVVRRNIYEVPGVRNRSNRFAIVTGIKCLEQPNGEPLPYKTLPIKPILAGFVANSVMYASALWLLLFAPGQLRRHLRHKRGRCIKCGYDLRGNFSAGCPECGWQRASET